MTEACLGLGTDLKQLKNLCIFVFEYVGYTCSFTGGSSQPMKDNKKYFKPTFSKKKKKKHNQVPF